MIDRGGRSLSARARVVLVAALVGTSLTALASSATAVGSGSTELVSVSPSGTAGNGGSGNSLGDVGVSDDGRYVVFTSDATDLVAGDENGVSDVFVRDRAAGQTLLVSSDASGAVGQGVSYGARISGDGRYVTFTSSAALVPADTNGVPDAYVRDLVAGSTELGSLAGDGSLLGGGQQSADISADGRHLLFSSADPDLTAGRGYGLFARDRTTGVVTRMDVATDGTLANQQVGGLARISANGRFVGYSTEATNLIANDALACTEYVYPEPDPSLPPWWPPGDPEQVPTNCLDVFVHDRDPDGDGILDDGATTVLASVTSDGTQADGNSGGGSVSNDGDVVFWSVAPNLGATRADVFVRSSDGTILRVGDAISNMPVITPDGSHVVYDSYGAQGLLGDTNGAVDTFVRDVASGTVERVSVAPDGSELTRGGANPAISADGRYVTFTSTDSTYLPTGSPSEPYPNVFLHDRDGVPAPPNTAPVAQDSARTVPADVTSDLLLSASDPDGDPLTYTVTVAPEHGTLGGTAPALTYTPEAGFTGSDSVVYTVTDGRGGSDTATASVTVSASGERSVTQDVTAGQTVSSGADPSPETPTQAAVTTPEGGQVSITETPGATGPTGYDVVGSQYLIEAPDATVAEPLRLSFAIDAGSLPAGVDAGTLTVFRDGSPIDPCADSSGTATPDPCIASREQVGDTIRITVLSSHASLWSVALPDPQPTVLTAAPAVQRTAPGKAAVKTVVLSARLTTTDGPVVGATIGFATTSGSPLCEAVTDGRGTATCSLPLTQQSALLLGAGYRATFAGTATLEPSSATAGKGRKG